MDDYDDAPRSPGFARIDWEITAPQWLTQTGQERKFRSGSTFKIAENVRAAVEYRVDALKADIMQTYVRRSSGATYASVRADVQFSEQSVTGGMIVDSPAVRFITRWGGNFMIPAIPRTFAKDPETGEVRYSEKGYPVYEGGFKIYPAEKEFMIFIGREGRPVAARVVHHPGFNRDVISEHMELLRGEVEQATINAIKNSTIEWADSLGAPKKLKRQYRYSTPAGRPG